MTTVSTHAVYRPVAAAIDPSAKLFAAEWALLLNLTGRHSLAHIGRSLGLDAQVCERAAARLLERGLIVESATTAAEYLAAVAGTAPETAESTLLELLQRSGLAILSTPTAPNPAVSARAAASPEPPPSPVTPPTVGSTSPPPFRPVARAVATAPPVPAARARGLSLRELMAFLISRARNREQGQLDVYRVFLRVRRDALERSGITTLRFDEDRIVSDPVLLDSIGEAVESVLGLGLPATVWVEQQTPVLQ